ncbi:hypothetical protein LNTAR_03564 [Lentisphaera araneosa HTCC2155]|uniref:Uncharacterized protein n=1 Tax=Lentisphaera araneosa HTCC2155 TaxID=313628 RepID=A6DSS1_9BACT|nr:hypothetical protein LNTAR_03564 [Lentisphaera araneosa HTCC2155]
MRVELRKANTTDALIEAFFATEDIDFHS